MIVTTALAVGASSATASFQPPFQVKDAEMPISVDVCHAAPLYVDYDGDGKKELLVGQFGEGKVRIYRNEGTNKAPKFKGFAWFQAGGAVASVPAG